MPRSKKDGSIAEINRTALGIGIVLFTAMWLWWQFGNLREFGHIISTFFLFGIPILFTTIALWTGHLEHGENAFVKAHGWARGSYKIHRDIHSFPIGIASAVPASNIAGEWRGRQAESVLIPTNPTDGVVGYFRLDIIEFDARLPRVEIIPRGEERFVPTGREWDIEVESAEFNRRFRILALDTEYAHAIVHPLMMERLLQRDARGLPVTIVGTTVFTWALTATGTKGLKGRLNVLSDVADLIPAFVKDKYSLSEEQAIPEGTVRTLAHPRAGSKNWLAPTAWALVLTLILAPIGVLVAQAAIRAEVRGTATNGAFARKAILVGVAILGAIVLAALIWLEFWGLD